MKRNYHKLGNYAVIVITLIIMAFFLGCTSSDFQLPPPPAPAGKVVLGNVSGAIVFADQVGTGIKYTIDPAEAAYQTISRADGTYTLPATPPYTYIIVSLGGTDSANPGVTAMTMTAPAGSARVSPLTSLVVADPAMAAVISGLGVSYDADITTAVTPAAAFLVQSIQATVNSLTTTLETDAGVGGLKNSQIVALQQNVITKMAAQLKTQTTTQLTTVANLTTTLQTAVTNTLADTTLMNATNGAATINYTPATTNAAAAAAIVPTAVITAVSTAIGSTSTTGAVTEASLVSAADVTAINTSVSTAVTTAVTTTAVTPPPNTPPTISGSPTLTLVAGTAYSFTPTATDPNTGDILTFSIVNRPDWADFNFANGRLFGTPPSALTYSNIQIFVSDGPSTVSLPAFTITVTTPTGGTGGTGGTGTGSGF